MNYDKKFLLAGKLILLLYAFFFLSCSSTKQTEIKSAEDLFELGKTNFEKGNYDEANKYFDLLKLQYPASEYADDAQYYIAEISFRKKEYIMAAFNFSWLRRSYPSSPYLKEAFYKTGLSYYHLSPTYDRDQEYTYKAIEVFQEFINYYPNDSLTKHAKEYVTELRNKLAYKNYHTATIYYKLESYRSALIYLDFVIDDFPDTDVVEDALFLKAQIYFEKRLFYDLKEIINDYKSLFPNGKYLINISEIENQIKEK